MDKRLTQRVVNDDQKQRMVIIMDAAQNMLKTIEDCCHEGREKEFAVMRLEECLMWANKSVAHEND